MLVKVCKLKEIKDLEGNILGVGTDVIEPKLPTYGKEGDACMDIYPIGREYDPERDRWIYHTGLAFAIGDNQVVKSIVKEGSDYKVTITHMPNEMSIRPRSNLTKSDYYMSNTPGTLDCGYRGELLIIFKNRTSVDVLNAIRTLTTAVERLALRVGANYEIKQYIGSVRTNIKALNDSIANPPYECDGEDRCCQIIINGAERIEFEKVETVEELGTTERGAGGFGSTGGAVK